MRRSQGIAAAVTALIVVLIAAVYCLYTGMHSAQSLQDTMGIRDKMEAAVRQVQRAQDEASADEEQQIQPIEENPNVGSQDIVLFGVDSRTGQLGAGTRSDSIMIVHLDHELEEVRVMSIYRDCMVRIEGHGYEKITHAHSYGGPDLALDTINTNFDLDIHDYVTVNFNNMVELVDMIGGVELYITPEEVPHVPGISDLGLYTVDGEQALAYSRIRHASGGDYGRTERQRTVLFKLFEKAKGMDTSMKLQIADTMLRKINTNLRNEQVAELLLYIDRYSITEMAAFPKVFYGGTVEGAWVEVPVTLQDAAAGIHAFLYGQTEYSPSETVQSIGAELYSKASVPNQDQRESWGSMDEAGE